MLDPSLGGLLPDDLPVTRVAGFDADRWMKRLGRVRLARVARTLTPTLPNAQASWVPAAYRAGVEALEQHRFSLIYSSAYPIAAHLTAWLLKRRSGLAWVADYRDEWSLRGVVNWPTPLHRRLARALDRAIVGTADQIVTTSPAHTSRFTHAFEPQRPIRTITNGFDPKDFEASLDGEARTESGPRTGEGGTQTGEGAPRSDERRMVIAHVGTLFEWRFPRALLGAVARLVRDGTIPAHRLTLEFVGFGEPEDDLGLRELGILKSTGYVSHSEAVSHMSGADLLLLYNTERTNIPGKTFEYLAARRPILALCEEGPTCDVVRDAGAGLVLEPHDEPAIASALERAFARWCAGEPAIPMRDFDTRRYSREELARQLHETFEGVLEPVPSAVLPSPEE